MNRAVSEGRACADKSSVTVSDGTTNHAVSDTESANTTTSTPKPLIRNELLCYVFNKMDLAVHDSLVKVCTDLQQEGHRNG